MRAYVLVNFQTMEIADVVEMMRQIKGVVAIDVTFGPYDPVAIVEASDLNTLGRITSCARFDRCRVYWTRSLA